MTEEKDNSEKKIIEVPVFFCPHCGEILPDDLVQYIIRDDRSKRSRKYWSDEDARAEQAAKAKARRLFELGVKARQEQARQKRKAKQGGGDEESKKEELTQDELEWKQELCRRMQAARKRNSQARRESGTDEAKEGARHHVDAKIRNIIQGIYVKNAGLFAKAPTGIAVFLGMKGLPTVYFNSTEELTDALLNRVVFRNKQWSVRPYTMDDGTILYGISVVIETKGKNLNRLYAIAAHVDVTGIQNPNMDKNQ